MFHYISCAAVVLPAHNLAFDLPWVLWEMKAVSFQFEHKRKYRQNLPMQQYREIP